MRRCKRLDSVDPLAQVGGKHLAYRGNTSGGFHSKTRKTDLSQFSTSEMNNAPIEIVEMEKLLERLREPFDKQQFQAFLDRLARIRESARTKMHLWDRCHMDRLLWLLKAFDRIFNNTLAQLKEP